MNLCSMNLSNPQQYSSSNSLSPFCHCCIALLCSTLLPSWPAERITLTGSSILSCFEGKLNFREGKEVAVLSIHSSREPSGTGSQQPQSPPPGALLQFSATGIEGKSSPLPSSPCLFPRRVSENRIGCNGREQTVNKWRRWAATGYSHQFAASKQLLAQIISQ